MKTDTMGNADGTGRCSKAVKDQPDRPASNPDLAEDVKKVKNYIRVFGTVEHISIALLNKDRIDSDKALARIEAALSTAREMGEALEEWDGLIKHQYSGTREAMSDMTYAAKRGLKILKIAKAAGIVGGR